MTREPRTPLADLTEDQLESLYNQLDAHVHAVARRTCLVPGCLKQYDALAAMTGDQPPSPELAATGWKQLRTGSIFPTGGNICPTHADLVTTHLPRRLKTPSGRWTVDCACGWSPLPQRWHRLVAALWEEHILTELGHLPPAPPLTDPEHRVPLTDHTEQSLAELYDRLWDAEDEMAERRDASRSFYQAWQDQNTLLNADATHKAGVHNALLSLRLRIRHVDRDWGQNATDAGIYALLIGWDCEQQHQHTGDCPAALNDIAEKYGWSAAVVKTLRKHRAALAQAGPNGETDAQVAREMGED
ncbi:hypothetical protein ACFY8X_38615 [Streptomyces tanashiensis]|uniref:hypothetical protein n=1 Tax=Streptomyces tanashiensis TaxID=67367 RepID=UPI0036EFB2AF